MLSLGSDMLSNYCLYCRFVSFKILCFWFFKRTQRTTLGSTVRDSIFFLFKIFSFFLYFFIPSFLPFLLHYYAPASTAAASPPVAPPAATSPDSGQFSFFLFSIFLLVVLPFLPLKIFHQFERYFYEISTIFTDGSLKNLKCHPSPNPTNPISFTSSTATENYHRTVPLSMTVSFPTKKP